jgi:hypothetical protein
MTDNTSQQDTVATAQQEFFKLRFVRILSIIQILFALIGIVIMWLLTFYLRPNESWSYMDIVNLRNVEMLGLLRTIVQTQILDSILYLMIILQVIIMIENRGRYWIYPLLATMLSMIYLIPQMIMLLNQDLGN